MDRTRLIQAIDRWIYATYATDAFQQALFARLMGILALLFLCALLIVVIALHPVSSDVAFPVFVIAVSFSIALTGLAHLISVARRFQRSLDARMAEIESLSSEVVARLRTAKARQQRAE
jgi:ABC-type multidrug transport system fused ATPase/permease subunit